MNRYRMTAGRGPRQPDLPRPVWLLGWVSLLTDMATEMIYPLLPMYLSRVLGAGAVSLGVIEGVAEGVNSLLKIVSGRLSDYWSRRKPIVIAGYTLSSLARPLVGVTTSWTQVLVIRALDRMGKGIRGAPRDAMLAGLAASGARGRIFGFHRAMDHAGAVVGPLVATAFLLAWPGEYRTLFALAIVPGGLSVWMLSRVTEPDSSSTGRSRSGASGASAKASVGSERRASDPDVSDRIASSRTGSVPRVSDPDASDGTASDPSVSDRSVRIAGTISAGSAPPLPARFWALMGVLLVFSLGNSTDAFLLLRLSSALGHDAYLPLLWASLHVVKASLSLYGGALSDRVGRKAVIVAGWCVYSVVYVGFALTDAAAGLVAWFLVYGTYFGLTEGTEKALVADLAPAARQGTAFGVYNAALGAGALLASIAFGVLYERFGHGVAFGVGAGLAALAAVLLLLLPVRATDNP